MGAIGGRDELGSKCRCRGAAHRSSDSHKPRAPIVASSSASRRENCLDLTGKERMAEQETPLHCTGSCHQRHLASGFGAQHCRSKRSQPNQAQCLRSKIAVTPEVHHILLERKELYSREYPRCLADGSVLF